MRTSERCVTPNCRRTGVYATVRGLLCPDCVPAVIVQVHREAESVRPFLHNPEPMIGQATTLRRAQGHGEEDRTTRSQP